MTKTMQALLRNEHGSALPFFAMGLMMLMGAGGIALDMGRLQIVQSRMQNALDAAGLAVGSEVSTVDLNNEAGKYFYANFPVNYMGTTITTAPNAILNADQTLITLNVAGTLDMTFMKIFGKQNSIVSATTQITRQSKGLELVLVMDVTGSMSSTAGGGVSKMAAAKTAAQSLLDTLYGPTRNTSPNLWVGVVPFSQAVNVGSGYTAWLDTTYANTLNWGTTSWGGCVEARTNGSNLPRLDVSDDPPSVRTFRPYYSPCNTNSSYSNRWFGTNASNFDNCSSGTGFQYRITSSKGPNQFCPVSVQPLVAEKSTVMAKINAMQPNGNTQINLGLAWGFRMLSPRWRGLWGGQMNTNQLPLDYNTPLMTKVVILMTDGDNTLSGTSNANTVPSYSGMYSAMNFPNVNALAVTGGMCSSSGNCNAGELELDNRTAAACTAMKANGIIIYTIGLGTGLSTASQTLLRNCATNSSYYFLSPTTSQLQTVFKKIGDSLANLRISQ
jgi:Flp pilus assembly protein TadG